MTFKMPKSIHCIGSYGDVFFHFQMMCIVTSPLDWPWKTTPKLPLTLWNLSTGSKVMEMSFFMSADGVDNLIFFYLPKGIACVYVWIIFKWSKGCLQKKIHMEGNCPNLSVPPPHFKSREQNRKEFFWALDPLTLH